MAGAGPYHHALSNLDGPYRLNAEEEGKPRFLILPQGPVPVNEPFVVYCSVNPDGYYEFTADEALVENVQGENYATITPLQTGTLHVSARWFKDDGSEYVGGDAKLGSVEVE